MTKNQWKEILIRLRFWIEQDDNWQNAIIVGIK